MIKKDNKEQDLLNRLLLKDEKSWNELFNMYSGNLNYVCLRYVSSKENSYDILQDSFITIFNSIHLFEFRGEGSLRAWITKIVVNEALKYLRESVRKDFAESVDDLPDQWEDDTVDDKIFHMTDLSQDNIMKIISSLPLGYRTIFNLYVFEEKSHKEIADLLGIAEKSSASQFHRAKKAIVKKINESKNVKTIQHE